VYLASDFCGSIKESPNKSSSPRMILREREREVDERARERERTSERENDTAAPVDMMMFFSKNLVVCKVGESVGILVRCVCGKAWV
jgi:hypothetical protein